MPTSLSLGQVAAALGEFLEIRLVGSADTVITGVAGIEEAVAGQVTFVSNPKYTPLAKTTQASAIIVAEDFPEVGVATLRTKNPYHAFARALELFYEAPPYPAGIHPTAVVDASAKIGARAHIGAYVVVDAEVELGDDCVLLPHVVIYRGAKIGHRFFAHAHAVVREFCQIGNGVVLQNGVIIGGDGFGFAKDGVTANRGNWHKIPQTGPAILGDDVEVQSNATVDRASVGETRVGAGAKIDNLAQVGHGATIGERTLLCAQVGVAGSAEVGNDVILAGQVGVVGHLKIGDGAIVTAQSGVGHDIAPGSVVSGSPAFDNKIWLRSVALFQKLPELAKKMRER